MKTFLTVVTMLSILAGALLFTPAKTAFAQTCSGSECDQFVGPPEPPGNQGGETITLPNPIGENNPQVIIGNLIRVVLGMVGSLALALFIYGGIMMMTSAGNEKRIETGRNTLVWATIGLIVIFSSYAAAGFILKAVSQA